MSSLVLESGDLVLKTPYISELVRDLKATIPSHGRRYNPENKTWIVAYMYGMDVVNVCAKHGIRLTVPKQMTQVSRKETCLLRIEYIGTTKERNDGTQSSFAYCNGSWSVVMPLDVLRGWFESSDGRPDEQPSYYAVLGVKRDADDTQLKKAYRIAAKTWHPDLNSEPDAAMQFRAIQEAYEVLSDPQQRRKHDAALVLVKSLDRKNTSGFVRYGYKPPRRCGLLTVEGKTIVGRFVVSKILYWDDILNAAGETMVTYWPIGADMFERDWI
jgi:DnaJ-domain-containing protein 1